MAPIWSLKLLQKQQLNKNRIRRWSHTWSKNPFSLFPFFLCQEMFAEIFSLKINLTDIKSCRKENKKD